MSDIDDISNSKGLVLKIMVDEELIRLLRTHKLIRRTSNSDQFQNQYCEWSLEEKEKP